MSAIRKLAGQTVLYGLSSIVGRLLNYLLTPLYTTKEVFSVEQYGVITEMYSYVAFLVIFLTYGMETSLFRYATKLPDKKKIVIATVLRSILVTSSVFIVLCAVFQQSIAEFLKYPDHSEYVLWFAIIVGLDALSAIPMAKLRLEDKPLRFALINLGSVLVNIALNLFFLAYCLPKYHAGDSNALIDLVYNPAIGVGYVFIANLISSIFKFLLLAPSVAKSFKGFDFSIFKEMMKYALPLLIVGIGFYINENFDRIMLKRMLYNTSGEAEALRQVGIYGANYKLSIIIILFIQAFRYAADPFYFNKNKDVDAKDQYAQIMNWFLIVVCSIFLMVTLFIDYWEGLVILPVLLMANIFQGLYYNISFWYKLTDKTHYGSYLAIFGAMITLVLNYIFIPQYGYVACAWVTFTTYGTMLLISYFLGQKFYKVPYDLKRIFLYIVTTVLIYFGFDMIKDDLGPWRYTLAFLLLAGFSFGAFTLQRRLDLIGLEKSKQVGK
jgi:O-antigen/teichoic acid export membrane protein